jgi:hypothetical protein
MRALLVGCLILAATSVEGALPAPPFDLTLSSVSPVEGQSVTVRVEPRPGGAPAERHDIYLMLASVEEAAFLTPAGSWASQPVPYVSALAAADPPVVRQWPRAWPPGRFALGLVAVSPGADPLARSEWRYRPAIAWISIAPRAPSGAAPAFGTLALLGAALVVAIGLVWWAGTARG